MDTKIDSRIKRVGTREEVFKGLAIRTAGGLLRDDIITKQFGSRVLYISKRLSDRMRVNFNIIRVNNPNYLRRQQKKTLGINSTPLNTILNNNTSNNSNNEIEKNKLILEQKKKQNAKTQKLSFKMHDNSVKTVYYKELQGMNIKALKEELEKEEAEEDLGIVSTDKKEFSIEEMPDIDLASIQ